MRTSPSSRTLYTTVASSNNLVRLATGGLFHARSALLGAFISSLLLLSLYALTDGNHFISKVFSSDKQYHTNQNITTITIPHLTPDTSTAAFRTPYEHLDTYALSRQHEHIPGYQSVNDDGVFINNPSQHDTCQYPVISLMNKEYCRNSYVLYQSLVRLHVVEGYTTCLKLLYRDNALKETNHIDVDKWKPVEYPFGDDPYCSAMVEHSKQYNIAVEFWPLPPMQYPDWISLPGTSWAYSFLKIHSFGMINLNRFLFVDSDFVFVRQLDRIFHDAPLDSWITGIPDQADGCNGRRAMNGGFVVVQPSRYLHDAAVQCIDDKRCSCLGGTWRLFDQEMMQCFCGFGLEHGEEKVRHDIPCAMLPVYNSVWPLVWWCEDIRSQPVRTLHYMGDSKPWEGETLKNGTRIRRVDTWSEFFWCIHDNTFGVDDVDQRRLGLVDCTEKTNFHY